jgi:hypothetical protein
MDLEQILGRQRLEENPWKNNATMFVKTTRIGLKTTWEEFKARLDEKERKTISLLSIHQGLTGTKRHDMAENLQKIAKTFHYKDDYVAVNEHAGNTLVPVLNNLMMVSEMRTFEVQQVDYADRFKVFNAIGERQIEGVGREVEGMFETFSDFAKSKEKLRYLVKVSEMKLSEEDLTNFLSLIPERYREYYTEMGPDRIKANGYQESKLKEEWAKQHQEELGVSDGLILDIAGYFKLGQRYSKSGIKDKLKELYKKHGYQKTAKASDLEEYFWLKTVKFIEGGKWVNGFEIQKKR